MNSKIASLQKTSLVLIGCVILFGCKGPKTSETPDTSNHLAATTSNSKNAAIVFPIVPESGPVSVKAAQDMRTAWVGKHPLYEPDGQTVLEGFSFDATQIDEIINHNHAGGDKPNKVVFYFGYDSATNQWHIIAYGRRNGTLLTGTTSNADPSIFDKADPCPPCTD